jgi:AraC-like DNA-binding protein
MIPRDRILMQEIHDMFYQKPVYERISVAALFTGLLYHWYGSTAIPGTVDLKAQQRNINRMHVEKSIYYLKHHMDESINIQELAQSQHLTPEHLSRLFKKEMGMTPHQYMTRIKMEEAMHLLTTSDRTLEDIAESLGYSDAFHFSHVFSKFTGLSPAKYRQANSTIDPYQPVTGEKQRG